ncbi:MULTISPECIES: electron transfer flavoprotein subunit alpha/FixB family protein [Salimicrobium]|uniref:Electron transfer flavoprotein subunit alpha n=3 Tax=Salimicrobium TaxID=351195 RepID=K2GP51_9BACI|nr:MULTISPECIES: electron transfer flavoprotein subunit alpha/FixB family protein [Salimicrobium]AKG04175.1 electron transfer flavoprotein subunit alpha [Salimicrobium jeotgali]EKE32139.1 electron transfer flavoprotein subunit alpha [Salimicrobium jeotgali]MBM7695750.1 electron transfer flavoprotein alpha subunit [Salimicrobium jeotgali]SDX60815.1 electron transfer flavoprotein alpha subunit [Salimicrobium album]SIS50216.1 electron transfer flavoprotein alpha subunit apoprotein [Salimicrobium 
MSKNILVIAEAKEGELRNVSFEAIALGKTLSEGGEVVATICGEGDLNSMAEELIKYGADRAVTVANAELKTYTPEGFTQAYKAVIDQESPDGIVMGHTSIGKDVTPKLASQLETGLISDVTEVEEGDDGFVFTRPIYSGKAFEKKVVTEGITFVTIRPNNIAALEKDDSRSGDVSSLDVDVQNIRTIIKEVIRKTSEGVDLSEAKVIVAGGRAVKGPEGFEPLQELADELGGAVGASRAACDAGYCDYSLQIGQTGKVVTPDLYIACGISGAIQHLAGMSNSKVIVAINKDPESNIFSIADYGLVGDIFEIVPKLTEEIRNMKVNA